MGCGNSFSDANFKIYHLLFILIANLSIMTNGVANIAFLTALGFQTTYPSKYNLQTPDF